MELQYGSPVNFAQNPHFLSNPCSAKSFVKREDEDFDDIDQPAPEGHTCLRGKSPHSERRRDEGGRRRTNRAQSLKKRALERMKHRKKMEP